MLNDDARNWIYNKIQGHYRREQYFQGLDISFYLSTFKYCLSVSKNFKTLEENLNKHDMNDCLDFVRKGDSPTNFKNFSYPSLSFQAECLYLCWDEIIEIQKQSGEDLSKAARYQRNLLFIEDAEEENWEKSILDTKRYCFGNKPNPNVQRKTVKGDSVQMEEERRVFPLAVDFKYEYNSFRRKVILECEKLTGKIRSQSNRKDVIFIQTDIVQFFHNLQVLPLAEFFEEQFPAAKNIPKYLRLVKEKYNYEDLPIGWILSRFIANIIVQKFHNTFKSYLPRQLKNVLEKKEFYIQPDSQIDLSKKWKVELKKTISYADDFIFLLTIPQNSKGIPVKVVADQLLIEAGNLLNTAIPGNKDLEFHEADSEKTMFKVFTKENITTLKSNFAFFDVADQYLIEDPEIKAKIDEVLLPIDNDITLNSSQQFHRNLQSLQKLVISSRHFKKKNVLDLLAQVKIKVEKTGSRYIRSVFGLLRLLMLSHLSESEKKRIRLVEIKQLFNKCKKAHNYSSEWVKFFGGYFNFLSSVEYKDLDLFFALLNEATNLMKKRESDDKILFQLMRNDFIYRCIIEAPDKIAFREKVLEDYESHDKPTLLKLSNQRARAVEFMCEALHPSTSSKNLLKPLDLVWLGIVLNQVAYRKHKIDLSWILSILDSSSKKADTQLLNYGLSRIAIGYLSSNSESNNAVFLKKAMSFRLPKNKFWEIAESLIEFRSVLTQHYKTNEKSRISSIIKTLKENRKDIIFKLISKSFKSQQYQLCSYLIVNRLNSENEFFKYILNSNLQLETSQLAPWSVIPLTFQKTGIAISLTLKELFDMPFNKLLNSKDLISNITNQLQEELSSISPKKLDSYFDSEKFGALQIDLDRISDEFDNFELKNKPFKITIAPLELDLEAYLDFNKGFKFKSGPAKIIDLGIRGAIDEAVKEGSSFLLFPELCLPRRYLNSYLRLASGHGIVLVGGLEYYTDYNKNAFNSTIISIPVKRAQNPGGRGFMAFEQVKNFPAAEENYHLDEAGFSYQKGKGIYIFKSTFWGDFAVLTCSDFLSLGLRWILQGEVQSVFVPAQNPDSVTYDHISETSIRDLHCLAIVCNNPKAGSSHCYAPYYNPSKRQLFKKVGVSQPEYHTFEITPDTFKNTQQNAIASYPFRDPKNKSNKKFGQFTEFKQLPPDWGSW